MSRSDLLPTPLRRDLGLDFLRATAILLVLSAHYFYHHIPFGGLIGVELFFSLSGFLIGRIILRELVLDELVAVRKRLAGFWLKRWFRTLPNYYAFLLGYLVVARIMTLEKFSDFVIYVPFLQNLAWPIGSFFGVSWSLAVEEWFYFVFPISLLLLKCLLKNARAAFWIAVAIFIITPPVLRLVQISNYGGSDWDERIRKVVIFRMDATMFGVSMAGISLTQPRLWATMGRREFLAAGTLLVGLGCIFVHGNSFSVALAFTLLPLGWALWIGPLQRIAVTVTEKFPRIAKNAITWVSVLSYSLYLCHMLIFDVVARLMRDAEAGAVHKIINRLIMIALTFTLAAVCYRWVEKPMLRLRDRVVD
jgi:peptidoglycan/LPS O-acetylase OafA/YrhL